MGIRVVTISRQYGAGGRALGERVAEALGFKLVDREIVEQAAARLGIDPSLADQLDERAPSLLEEIGLALAAATPEMGMPVVLDDDRELAAEVRRVIESMAGLGGYVVVGRGGQAILQGRDDAVHLQVVAELADRVRRLVAAGRAGSEPDAKELCKQRDAERMAYVRRFCGADLNNALLYDAVLNTSRIGSDGACAAALAIARSRGA